MEGSIDSREQLSAIELLASFIVDSGGGAFICVRWPPDGREMLVSFSDKRYMPDPLLLFSGFN
jgi:hypothetical protein